LLQQCGAGAGEAGQAEAALNGILRDQGQGKRVTRQPFDGRDVRAFQRPDRKGAAKRRAAVDDHRARAACAGAAAALLGPGKVGGVAQRPQQRRRGVKRELQCLTVDPHPCHRGAI
jgi:hypothetical protein